MASPTPHLKPWGIWITQHSPVPADTHFIELTHTVQLVWLLQDGGFPPQARSIWEYIRFVVMHFERPWDPSHLASRDPRFDRIYPLGFAHFAPFSDSEDLYLETLWGPRSGRGRRVRRTTPGALTEVELLWLS